MAKKEHNQYSTSVSTFEKGLNTDAPLISQPKGSYRFALNAINEARNGEQGSISMEQSNYSCDDLPVGFNIIGSVYIEDDSSVVILVNDNGKQEIGVIGKDNKYTTHVNTTVLKLLITNQCDVIYRLRRGNEKVIYWVDGNNKPRTYNLNRPYNFYNSTYAAYLQNGGNPITFIGEKWDISSFDLIKSYSKVPTFNSAVILETGSILAGSYNFAIQLVDEDLNPSEWIATSNTINIYNDPTTNLYGKIRGSKNSDTTTQSFPKTNKSIKLSIGNLDTSFPFYRVGIIQANSLIGVPNKVLVSQLYSTSNNVFIYSGNDSELTETLLGDILIDKEIIFAPDHIEQLENRLLLANTEGKGINWCDLQKFASKIDSDLVTKNVVLNSIDSEPNVKNVNSTFLFRGYMPGEVYSFGIVYLFDDGTTSPVFTIPGKSSFNTISKMKNYEVIDKYLNIHTCNNGNYWGLDAQGNTLLDKRIRHHRFPFRKEVKDNLGNILHPLLVRDTTTTTVTQYTLSLTITLNPLWTPVTGLPNLYPLDSNGDPKVISATFNYKVINASNTDQALSQLTRDKISVPIIIYQSVNVLDTIDTPRHYILDSSCDLFSYQDPSGSNFNTIPRFTIVEDYVNVPLNTSIDNDTSSIFGIKFSNIEKPLPNIVGFYIVRNEREEDDKLIVDNAIIGTTTSYLQYKSFGLINPKQTQNGIDYNIFSYDTKSNWIFNPEYQYLGKKQNYTSIEIEGKYNETNINVPTTSAACRGGCAYGVYINDVCAGTSYNPDIHKKRAVDDDGFDLIIGYRNTNFSYEPLSNIAMPLLSKIMYLSAASYENYSGNTYYNVSCDNKISIVTHVVDLGSNNFYNSITKKNSLLYGVLVREQNTCYSNFTTRPYYKEHNNPILFNNNNIINNIEIFNGDAQISNFNFISSVFYDIVTADRDRKGGLFQIILGAILIIAAVLITGGAALALVPLVISQGVALITSGVRVEQLKSMIQTDYGKGLKETVTDAGVQYTVRESVGRDDDTIRWFADRASNLYIESNVPFGLRSGLTCGVTDFIDSGIYYNEDEFKSYLTEKLTVVDRDNKSGRLYKGIPSAEFYDINKDYMRFNKEKIFIHLPIEYDCCSDSEEIFPNRIWYSEQSFQEEKTDNYRNFLPNNYRDIEGEHGEITDLYRLGNALFIHSKEALWQLPQNLQERVTNEIVSFIGTGDFFNIPPRKIVDDTLGSGGTQHKWGTVKTKNGVIFVSEIEGKIYLHSDSVKEISNKGLRNWFENTLKDNISGQLYSKFKIYFEHNNNPANINGTGYLSAYDTRYERILITKKDYNILSSKLSLLTLSSIIPVSGNAFTYCLLNGYFYQGTTKLNLTNSEYFENKSWTLSYSFHTGFWVSFHSYLPNYYVYNQNNLYTFEYGINKLWKHNKDYEFRKFYDSYKPFIVEYVRAENLFEDKILEDLTISTKAYKFDTTYQDYVEERFITFNKIIIYNSRQSTGELSLVVKNTQNNPENWYQQQIVNKPNEILINKIEDNWNLNQIRDNIIDYTKPIFTANWLDIKNNYFIDKVPNLSVLNFNKPWSELESLRDKFIIVRLKYDNTDNINLVFNYSLETEQNSNH